MVSLGTPERLVSGTVLGHTALGQASAAADCASGLAALYPISVRTEPLRTLPYRSLSARPRKWTELPHPRRQPLAMRPHT